MTLVQTLSDSNQEKIEQNEQQFEQVLFRLPIRY